jgi:8-oxo-dGTP diphosphatase
MTPDVDTPTRIGIGLVGRDGRYLIRRRPATPGSPLPGLWEFPGGKCEPGEVPERAALRECEEELRRPVVIQGLRRVVRHAYSHGTVELHFFDATLANPADEPDPATGFGWVRAEDLSRFQFPEANERIVRELAGSGP